MVADGKKDSAAAKPKMTGNYTYVGLDIDTTGRRLIDEIVQIAAYTPEKEFSQHIMPLMNLNPGARNRHKITVITVRCFRMLKSLRTYNVIKTKTEVAALNDFLDWIESLDKKDGIIFVYHEAKKFIPMMVIEALRKYRMLERFEKTVKSFVNAYDLDERENIVKLLNLSENLFAKRDKLELNPTKENEFEGDAAVRAKLTYEIVKLMSYDGTWKEMDEKELQTQVNEFVRAKAEPIAVELKDIAEQEECIKRQSSLSEIFRTYFQTSRYCRKLAVNFRRLLAEDKQDMESLKAKYDEGKRDALYEVVKKLNKDDFEQLKDEEITELVDIIDAHFDPEKKPVVNQRHEEQANTGNGNGNGNMMRRRRRGNGMGNGNGNGNGRRNSRGSSNMIDKENVRTRSNSGHRNRRRSTDGGNNNNGGGKRFGGNNNNSQEMNNNNNYEKTGAMRKEHQMHDNNANHMISAN